MERRVFPGVYLVVSAASWLLLLSHSASAESWVATAGTLGRDVPRFSVRGGVSYGLMKGSELEEMDPSRGFDVGVSVRLFGNVSAVGSFAIDTADVDGQVRSLVDQNVRPDGRSGTVQGQVETSRFRVGGRVDAWRERGWRFQPYLTGTVMFSSIDVTIDSVDGNPPLPVPDPDGGAERDISSFSESQLGGSARLGVEYRVASAVHVDVNGIVDFVEFQPGTNTIYSVNSGLVFRF